MKPEFPPVTLADWRAQVERELAGKSFEKTLVLETPEGLSIAPLYTDAPPLPLDRRLRASSYRICMRHAAGAKREDVAADIAGGADAIWLGLDEAIAGGLAREDQARPFFVFDTDRMPSTDALLAAARSIPSNGGPGFALNQDPLARFVTGHSSLAALPGALATLGPLARLFEERFPGSTAAMVSTLPYHDAGADAADEVAIALSTGARYLEALLESGLPAGPAARQIALQISVGRDTFLELCKVRALRICWQKLVAASGAVDAPRALIHAVCSSRTLAARDPWVNMLRATTQVFSAVLGGADLVTPSSFDQAWGTPSAHGRRVARNTCLVLREESFLGKVQDPAGGSYYLDTVTDALAREAWKRFRNIEREGGLVAALESGRLTAKLEAAWRARLEQIAKRKVPILGLSEFANLDEKVPRDAAVSALSPSSEGILRPHRDAEPFEELRARAESKARPPEAMLLTLGGLAESRPRVGFATGFLAAGGIRTRESTIDEKADIACVCGSDDRYVAEAAPHIRALKAAGCGRVLVAGRPGALEAELREAGADGFIFVGCDVVAVLSDLLSGLS